jgi:hypothetical protein
MTRSQRNTLLALAAAAFASMGAFLSAVALWNLAALALGIPEGDWRVVFLMVPPALYFFKSSRDAWTSRRTAGPPV